MPEFIEITIAERGYFDYNTVSGRTASKPGEFVEFAKQRIATAHPIGVWSNRMKGCWYVRKQVGSHKVSSGVYSD